VVTPIGPLAFDYGINLMQRVWKQRDASGNEETLGAEDRGNFHFSVGLF
jgi:hypothetical protein